MNLTDQEILIITEYVDGSPSNENIIAAKELIKTNTAAERFENELRTSRAALISEANSKENTNAINRLMEVFDKPKKNSLLEFFLDLVSFGNREKISFSQIGGGAFAGVAFSTAFAIFLAPNFMPIDTGNWNENGFSNSLEAVRMTKLNTRGEVLSDQENFTNANLENAMKETITKMIDSKNINGELLDADGTYKVKIKNIFIETNCFSGTIEFKNVKKQYMFCSLEKDNFLEIEK